LSFFDDETDEPSVTPRPAPRRRRPSGTGPRPPDQQAILVRRAVAAVVLLVVIILIIVGVHSCQVSARNTALKDYANNVSSLIKTSNQTGAQMFSDLSAGGLSTNPTKIYNQILDVGAQANTQLKNAKGLSVPDEMRDAQDKLLLTMQMRADGIGNIAKNIQPALGTTTNRDAINAIATEMARLYSSDVVYKDYMVPLMIGALKSAGIALGGVPIESGQFLQNLDWLTPTGVTSKLGASASTPSGKPAPGLHGHSLDSVSVGGTTLQTGSTNTLPANPPPTITFHFTNGGDNDEHNVTLKVTLSGTSISGQTVVPVTTKHTSATADVKLSSAPPAGNYTLTATIAKVPGENNTTNNTLTFPVTFQ
jgi:hypothetical protein